jgi:hypothetical protein
MTKELKKSLDLLGIEVCKKNESVIEALGELEDERNRNGARGVKQEIRGNYIKVLYRAKDGIFYLPSNYSRTDEVFIKGEGTLKAGTWKKYFIPMINENCSSVELQEYSKKYGDLVTQIQLGVDLDSYGARYGTGGRLWYYSRKFFGSKFDIYVNKYNKTKEAFFAELLKNDKVKINDEKISFYKKHSDGSAGYHDEINFSKVINYSFPDARVSMLVGAQFPNIDVFEFEKVFRGIYLALNKVEFKNNDEILNWLDNHSMHQVIEALSNSEIANDFKLLVHLNEDNIEEDVRND